MGRQYIAFELGDGAPAARGAPMGQSSMETTIDLYGALTGNCIRAAISLEEAGVSYTAKPVNLAAGEHRGAQHRALNAFGKVPVLVERSEGREFVLTQSNAIMLFAAERSQNRLQPADPLDRARVLERFFYFVTDVIAVSHSAFRLEQMGAKEQAAAIHEVAYAAMVGSERFLQSSPFMAGDAFSIADIAAFTIAHAFHGNVQWGNYPELARWYESVAGRPGVVAGQKAFA